MITCLLKEDVPFLESLGLRASHRMCQYDPRDAVQKYWWCLSPDQCGCVLGDGPAGDEDAGLVGLSSAMCVFGLSWPWSCSTAERCAGDAPSSSYDVLMLVLHKKLRTGWMCNQNIFKTQCQCSKCVFSSL